MSALPEGEAKVRTCEEKSEKAMETTALKGRQAIQQELDVLKLDWEDYSIKLSSLQDNLEKAVQHWGQYEDQYGIISQWVKDMERRIKDCPLKSTLEEKQDQLKRYQVIYLVFFPICFVFFMCDLNTDIIHPYISFHFIINLLKY